MTADDCFADFPRDSQGHLLDPTTGLPLTQWEMEAALAAQDPATARAFNEALAWAIAHEDRRPGGHDRDESECD